MVKIEHVWEEMENSCFCLGLGARQADGQARAGQENLDLGPSEYTPHLPDSRAEPDREEYGTLECSKSRGVHMHNALPLPRH